MGIEAVAGAVVALVAIVLGVYKLAGWSERGRGKAEERADRQEEEDAAHDAFAEERARQQARGGSLGDRLRRLRRAWSTDRR